MSFVIPKRLKNSTAHERWLLLIVAGLVLVILALLQQKATKSTTHPLAAVEIPAPTSELLAAADIPTIAAEAAEVMETPVNVPPKPYTQHSRSSTITHLPATTTEFTADDFIAIAKYNEADPLFDRYYGSSEEVATATALILVALAQEDFPMDKTITICTEIEPRLKMIAYYVWLKSHGDINAPRQILRDTIVEGYPQIIGAMRKL